ncbi:hypothetical protein [Pseudomonas sp. LD120]|uniref:hypothetical protein n=1 Tax=Pseudomonas sp. LD120 TaxID=485751 RepID=UPI00135B7FB2|nr:hypothetical protein [Pseudomonas sp. LD120]KAF0865281.1 hypothetical protein PLD_08305 [Pseudomonas sp. LD120]
MLTVRAAFVMSSLGLFAEDASPGRRTQNDFVQIASPQKAIIAKCNQQDGLKKFKPLFLKHLCIIKPLARGLL